MGPMQFSNVGWVLNPSGGRGSGRPVGRRTGREPVPHRNPRRPQAVLAFSRAKVETSPDRSASKSRCTKKMPEFIVRVGTPDGHIVERQVHAMNVGAAQEEFRRQGMQVFAAKRGAMK